MTYCNCIICGQQMCGCVAARKTSTAIHDFRISLSSGKLGAAEIKDKIAEFERSVHALETMLLKVEKDEKHHREECDRLRRRMERLADLIEKEMAWR